MLTSPTNDKSHKVKATRPGFVAIGVGIAFFVGFFVVMSNISV